MEYNRIVLVHKGALGDFLQIWPTIYTLKQQLPDKEFYWAGKDSYTLWISPLGIAPALANIRQCIDRIYSTKTWPEELQDALVIWFGLHKPPTEISFPNLVFFYGIDKASYLPPRDIYAKQLSRLGIEFQTNWQQAWLDLFATIPEKNPAQILIFPGAGNINRCWPLRDFEKVAEWLSGKGFDPLFVLGPVEVERDFQISGFRQISPANLEELQKTILKSRAVVGNDTGPLHLAAYMQVPSVAIFGPASEQQWGPPGALIAKLSISCSPCSKIGRIGCSDPVCIKQIPKELVMEKVEQVLEKIPSKKEYLN